MDMLQISGLDIGNGYVKGSGAIFGSQPTGIDFPSGVALMVTPHDIKVKGEAVASTIDDIFNEMDVTFDSPLIKDPTRRLFGRRGVQSGMVMEEFDVASGNSKALQPLSAVLVLGCIAGKALQTYWNENQALPDRIMDVHVRVALSLPISEYKQFREAYAHGFMDTPHMVNIHNFEIPVRIQVTFDDVQVIAEGASAMYAISNKGLPLMESMLADVRRLGEPLPGIEAKDILAAENTVGIDIGEGTVNYPVFQAGRFNPDASMTFNQGYGSVMNRALIALQAQGIPFASRKAMSEFMQAGRKPLTAKRYDIVQHAIDQETIGFAQNVVAQFRNVMSKVGAFAEVVYVYGGGATPVKDILYPMLIDASRSMGSEDSAYPVLYLDSRYSRYLNREGLYIMASVLANRVLGNN